MSQTRYGADALSIQLAQIGNDLSARAFLEEIARLTGSDWRPSEGAPGYAEQREAMIDRLADACEDNLDVPALLEAAS